MKTTLISLSLVSFVAAGCGPGNQSGAAGAGASSPDAVDATPAASLLLTDPQAAGQTAAAQVDVGIAAAAEENDLPSGAGDGDDDGNVDYQRSRDCTAQNGDAVVDVRESITRAFDRQGPVRDRSVQFAAYVQRQRTFSRANGTVACAADGKRADLQLPDLAGVSLAATLNESRSRSVTFTNDATGATSAQSYKYTLTGTRNVTWSSASETNGTYQIQKTATHDLQRTLQITPRSGTPKTLTSSVANADRAPFQILVVRDATTLAVQSRTIQSGTLEAVHKDGTRVETVFADVVYQEGQGCVAQSGQITGSIFPSGATTASLTFTVDFTSGSGQITFSNGQTAVYTADGCALDQPANKAVDVASASDVTPPVNVTAAP